MKRQKYIFKLLIVIAILSTSFFALTYSHYYQTNVSSGNCGSGHTRLEITISTNYTGNAVLIDKGGFFDLEITAVGLTTGDVWVGYAFWHTGSDGIQLPDTSPFIPEDNLVNEWNDGDDYYAMFAWETVVNPMTRTFRINTTSMSGTEILTIQVAGEGAGTQGKYSNVIAFEINIKDDENPDVIIIAPTDNAYVSGSSVLINATVDDGIGCGVDEVWAEITNSTYSENVTLSGIELYYSGIWDSTVVVDGTYTITIVAEDEQDNSNDTESINVIVNNHYAGPQITIIEPSNSDSGNEPPEFEISVNDVPIDKKWYVIFNGIEWSQKIFFTGDEGSIDETLWDSLNNGELVIRFYVNDTFGNFDYDDVGYVKTIEEEEEEEEEEGLKINEIQMILISALMGVSFIGGVVVTRVNIKRKLTPRRFESTYERDYYKYYGKKPKKQENTANRYK